MFTKEIMSLVNTNYDAERFAENNDAVTRALLQSETGRTVEHHRKQLFPIITAEEIQERDAAKAKVFNEESYKKIRKTHRPDLGD